MKKLLSLILFVTMFLTLMAVPTSAAADVWDGNADTSWYNDTDTTFTLTTAEQLAGLTSLVNAGNNFSGKTVALGADVDLNNVPWTPIGTEAKGFAGTFDGQGHTISNLKNANYNATVDDWTNCGNYQGFFGFVLQGTVKNVGIINANISFGAGSTHGALIAVGYAVTVENCYVANATLSGWHTIGGLVGQLKSDNGGTSFVNRCYVVGTTITSPGNPAAAGGLVGSMNGAAVINNCYSVSNIEKLIGGDAVEYAEVVNSFYQAAASGGNDALGAVAKTEAEMKSPDFVTVLNTGIQGDVVFVAAASSYPVLGVNQTSGSGSSSSPNTGDNAAMVVAIAVAALAGALITKKTRK